MAAWSGRGYELSVRAVSLFLFLVTALSACVATSPPLSPQTLQTHSLVVGRIAAVDWHGHAEVPPATADLRIDGIVYRDAVRNGHFAVALTPGTHKLQAIVSDRRGLVQTRSLDKTLEVAVGSNVDAGLLLLWFGRDPRGNGYHILPIDNRKEMTAYVRRTYPQLSAAMGRRNLVLARYRFLSRKEVLLLREEIVKRIVLYDRTMWPLVAGAVGTVARLQSGHDGKPASIQLFDSRTLTDFRHCERTPGHLDCLMVEGDGRSRLLDFDGRRIVYRGLAPGFVPRRVFRSRQDTLYVVDAHLRILSLSSGRRRWQRYEGAAREVPLPPSETVYFRQTPAGLYINSSGRDGTIVFRDPASGRYSHIGNPGRGVYMWNIVDVPGGILVGGTRGGWHKRYEVYFRSPTGMEWERRGIPARACSNRLIPVTRDDVTPAIGIRCDGRLYLTTDQGRNWRQVEDKPSVRDRARRKRQD